MPKKAGARSPRNKERPGPGFRTVGLRVSEEYAGWLARAAAFDRVTVAAFLDRAAADRAKAIGYAESAPTRIQ